MFVRSDHRCTRFVFPQRQEEEKWKEVFDHLFLFVILNNSKKKLLCKGWKKRKGRRYLPSVSVHDPQQQQQEEEKKKLLCLSALIIAAQDLCTCKEEKEKEREKKKLTLLALIVDAQGLYTPADTFPFFSLFSSFLDIGPVFSSLLFFHLLFHSSLLHPFSSPFVWCGDCRAVSEDVAKMSKTARRQTRPVQRHHHLLLISFVFFSFCFLFFSSLSQVVR